jgi:YidC/Oxa1 family membrane protein insertase
MTSIFGIPVDAAYHLVFALTTWFTPVLGGLAAVTGIVLLTLAVRLLMLPLSFRALRGQAIAAKLAPQLQALRAKYGKQPERLQRELTALYRKEGSSMFAGLSPALLQMPALSVLYLLFRSPRVGGQSNRLLSRELFGVPLGTHWLGGAGVVSGQGAVFAGVFVLLAVMCWLSARVARSVLGVPGQTAGGSAVLGRVLPYVTVVIATFTPLAAAVYLVTSTGCSVLERLLYRRGRTARSTSPRFTRTNGPSRAAR